MTPPPCTLTSTPTLACAYWGWQGAEAHRPQARVARPLAADWATACGVVLDLCTITANADRVVVEYRVQLNDPATDRCVEHNRVLVAMPLADQLHTLDLYCSEPVPSAPRRPTPAPAATTDAGLRRIFEESRYAYDPRGHGIALDHSDTVSLRGGYSYGAARTPPAALSAAPTGPTPKPTTASRPSSRASALWTMVFSGGLPLTTRPPTCPRAPGAPRLAARRRLREDGPPSVGRPERHPIQS